MYSEFNEVTCKSTTLSYNYKLKLYTEKLRLAHKNSSKLEN